MTKLHIIGAAVLAGAVIAGCGKNEAENKETAADTNAVAAAQSKKDPNEVIAQLGEKKLTRGELQADITKILDGNKDKIPAEQLDYYRQQLANQLAQQFIVENALIDKAKAAGFVATDEDRKARKEEFNKAAKANAGQGPKNFDDYVNSHPLGKERALAQFEDGIVIDKMIKDEMSKALTNDYTKLAKAEIETIISNNAKNATASTAALKKINDLKAKLTASTVTNVPALFAELAKANSDCPSGKNGGDLNFFTHGQMVKEFDEAAFGNDIGKVVGPVKTQFGYHLILVTDKTPTVEAKGDKPAEPEKVRASHILVKTPAVRPVPELDKMVQKLKKQDERQGAGMFVQKIIKEADIKVIDEFKHLLPNK